MDILLRPKLLLGQSGVGGGLKSHKGPYRDQVPKIGTLLGTVVYLLILSPGEGGVTPVVPEAPGLHTDSQMTKIHFDHLAELMKRPSKDGRKGREDSGTPKPLIIRHS